MKKFDLENEICQIIGLCMEVQRHLDHGFSELVYKNAVELEAPGLGFRSLGKRNTLLLIMK